MEHIQVVMWRTRVLHQRLKERDQGHYCRALLNFQFDRICSLNVGKRAYPFVALIGKVSFVQMTTFFFIPSHFTFKQFHVMVDDGLC